MGGLALFIQCMAQRRYMRIVYLCANSERRHTFQRQHKSQLNPKQVHYHRTHPQGLLVWHTQATVIRLVHSHLRGENKPRHTHIADAAAATDVRAKSSQRRDSWPLWRLYTPCMYECDEYAYKLHSCGSLCAISGAESALVVRAPGRDIYDGNVYIMLAREFAWKLFNLQMSNKMLLDKLAHMRRGIWE